MVGRSLYFFGEKDSHKQKRDIPVSDPGLFINQRLSASLPLNQRCFIPDPEPSSLG